MKRLDRTSRIVVAGAGLGAAIAASSEHLAQAFRIHQIYWLAGVAAWYVVLLVMLARSKRAICS